MGICGATSGRFFECRLPNWTRVKIQNCQEPLARVIADHLKKFLLDHLSRLVKFSLGTRQCEAVVLSHMHMEAEASVAALQRSSISEKWDASTNAFHCGLWYSRYADTKFKPDIRTHGEKNRTLVAFGGRYVFLYRVPPLEGEPSFSSAVGSLQFLLDPCHTKEFMAFVHRLPAHDAVFDDPGLWALVCRCASIGWSPAQWRSLDVEAIRLHISSKRECLGRYTSCLLGAA